MIEHERSLFAGAAQADAALLVANATRGEFETGFENGGQTREHAMLLRSLGEDYGRRVESIIDRAGVSQLVVAVNKMDTVEWSQQRYSEVRDGANVLRLAVDDFLTCEYMKMYQSVKMIETHHRYKQL